jgi:glucose/arabinose dehydrogenase
MKANKKCYGACLSLVLGAFAVCLAVTPASATTLFKGTFTVTTEVHWGKAVLPPGDYSLELDESARTMIISDAHTNKPVALEMVSIESGARNADSRLRLVGAQGQHVVYSVRLTGFGEVFHSEVAYEMARKTPKGTSIEEAVVIERSQPAGK